MMMDVETLLYILSTMFIFSLFFAYTTENRRFALFYAHFCHRHIYSLPDPYYCCVTDTTQYQRFYYEYGLFYKYIIRDILETADQEV